MSTVFHCILCLPEAGGTHPEFATGDALSEHLESAHQAPKPYVMREKQRLFSLHATIIQWDVVDAAQRVVGKAETITGRGGL
jgi:hypothetical protein